jgi:hypothetical protein
MSEAEFILRGANMEFFWTVAEPPEAKKIDVPAPGLFSVHMTRAFGELPATLTEKDIKVLEGMAATWTDISISPYVFLIQNIKRYKKIRVFMKYPDSDKPAE